MNGLRSVTIGTSDLNKSQALLTDVLGMTVGQKKHALRFGDADLASGTRVHVVEIPNYNIANNQINSIGLRVPTDEALLEYQAILKEVGIDYSAITTLNDHQYFHFKDHDGQQFAIYSNEHNSVTPLGMPSFDSSVNPLHQIQGLAPVIIKVNEPLLTQSILSKVFNLTHYAEYVASDNDDFKVQVFKIGDGGLGGELHLYPAAEEINMPAHGIVEQIEFATESTEEYQHALQQLEVIGIPYQTLDQGDAQSLRISENSGITFILTLEKTK